MPTRRVALAVSVALLLAATLAWACAPLAAPAGPPPDNQAQAEPPSFDQSAPGQSKRLALAAFHLRHERGLGPAEALKILDAPESAPEAAAGASGELALRALALSQLGRYAEAVATLDRLLLTRRDLPPTALADIFVERGLALAALGHQVRATEDYAAALALLPRHIPALMARADQSFALGRPLEAEADYSRALAIDPQSALAHINRGVTRDEQGRFHEAIEDFTRALALDPGSPVALMNRGVSRSQAGDLAGMCADYRAACRLGACHRLGAAQAMGYCKGED